MELGGLQEFHSLPADLWCSTVNDLGSRELGLLQGVLLGDAVSPGILLANFFREQFQDVEAHHSQVDKWYNQYCLMQTTDL